MVIDNIKVEAQGFTEEEIEIYIQYARENYGDIESLKLSLDEEYVNIEYKLRSKHFERIRRITGYLVGNTTRFNNAKSAELRDREKHSI